MTKQRLFSVFIVIMLISSLFAASAASAATTTPTIKTKTQSINLLFDGQALKLPDEQYSFIYKGRTYVPIRYMSYALQKSVKWDNLTSTASISEPTIEELAELKKQLQQSVAKSQQPQATAEIEVKQMKAALVFDGKAKTVPADQFLFNYKGSIYVPLRFLSEAVGVNIEWDAITKTVTSESKAYREEQSAGGVEIPTTEKPDEPEKPNGSGPVSGGTGGSGGAGGGPGMGETQLAYNKITADTEARLNTLRNSCTSSLDVLLKKYLVAGASEREAIKTQGQQEVDNCSVQFEQIMTDTTELLVKNGHSTAIINDYRVSFKKQLDEGRKLAGMIA